MSARLKELYDKNIKNELYKELSCKNINEVPKLVKIVLMLLKLKLTHCIICEIQDSYYSLMLFFQKMN